MEITRPFSPYRDDCSETTPLIGGEPKNPIALGACGKPQPCNGTVEASRRLLSQVSLTSFLSNPPEGSIPDPTTQEATQPEALPGPDSDLKDANQPSADTDVPPPIPDQLREEKESSLHVLPEPLAAVGH